MFFATEPFARLAQPGPQVEEAIHVGSIVENDSTIETDHPWPDLPAPTVDEILTEGGTVYTDVLATQDEVAGDVTDLLAEFAADKAAALDRLAQARAATDAAITETIHEANEKLGADKHAQAEASQRAAKASAPGDAAIAGQRPCRRAGGALPYVGAASGGRHDLLGRPE